MSRIPPKFMQLAEQYGVNLNGVVEALYQPQYDTLDYAAVGQTQLRFFQEPIGQNGKTIQETNMVSQGTFPAPQQFLATEICLEFIPGLAVDNAAVQTNAEDLNLFNTDGSLRFNVGSKNFLTDAPLGIFPPSHHIHIDGAGTIAVGAMSTVNRGNLYSITPVVIPFSQNFDVTLEWAALVPITTAATVRCHLNGFLYRSAQ